MPRKETEPLSKHLIHLYEGDYAKLARFYEGKLPASKVVRVIVRKFLDKIEAKVEEELSSTRVKIDAEDIIPTREELTDDA